jgi:hypothetical protein
MLPVSTASEKIDSESAMTSPFFLLELADVIHHLIRCEV